MLRRCAYLLAALLFSGAAMAQGGDGAPARVVSINLCADQMAMLLADEGQLHSVSRIALDPLSSAMADQAATFEINHGQAEEVYLMQPDLVLAGIYTPRATTDMLEQLGIPVVRLPVANRLEDVPDIMRQTGAALHREAEAEAMARAFTARLNRLRATPTTWPRAVLYYANGYTLGADTLSGQILLAAGFANVASELGYARGANLPLERLALAAPDLVITGTPYPGASRSEDILAHPIVDTFRRTKAVTGANWICGTPFVLDAIDDLIDARRTLEAAAPPQGAG